METVIYWVAFALCVASGVGFDIWLYISSKRKHEETPHLSILLFFGAGSVLLAIPCAGVVVAIARILFLI